MKKKYINTACDNLVKIIVFFNQFHIFVILCVHFHCRVFQPGVLPTTANFMKLLKFRIFGINKAVQLFSTCRLVAAKYTREGAGGGIQNITLIRENNETSHFSSMYFLIVIRKKTCNLHMANFEYLLFEKESVYTFFSTPNEGLSGAY